MKKSYLEPETTIVKMRHALLMNSQNQVKGINSGDTGINYGGAGTEGGRSRGIWDRWDD